MQLKSENATLSRTVKDYKIVRNAIGDDKVNHILEQAKLADRLKNKQKTGCFLEKIYFER